jgi:hypothetical protein
VRLWVYCIGTVEEIWWKDGGNVDGLWWNLVERQWSTVRIGGATAVVVTTQQFNSGLVWWYWGVDWWDCGGLRLR